MAKVPKKIGVTPVDDSTPPEEVVVRLSPEEKSTQHGRLEPPVTPHRLEIPVERQIRLEVSGNEPGAPRRTHEPDMEALVCEESGPVPYEETVWGEIATARQLPWAWFALLGSVLVGAVVWSLISAIQGGGQVTEEKQRLATDLAREEVANENMAAALERMKDTARRYCEAATPEQLSALVRDPQRVRPLMERYYAAHPYQPLGFVKHRRFRDPALPSYRPLWIVSLEIGDGSTKHLLVEQQQDGSFGVDWETAVVYQPMPWDQYVRERPRDVALDFRVKASEDTLFSHEFAESTRWACFRMTAPGSPETLWGYTPADGPIAAEIRKLIAAAGGRPAPLILRLTVPADMKSPKGVRIAELVSPRWIILERTTEEKGPATIAPR